MKSYFYYALQAACLVLVTGTSLSSATTVDLSKYDVLPMVKLQAQVRASAIAFQQKDTAKAISLLAPEYPAVQATSPAGQLETGWRLFLVGQDLLMNNDSATAKIVAASALSYLVGPALTAAEAAVHAQGLELAGQVEELLLRDQGAAIGYYQAAISLDSHRGIAVAGLARCTSPVAP